MEFLKSTADLLTFQEITDDDRKISGGVSVSSIMGMRSITDTVSGGGDGDYTALGTLKTSYIPIGLYLDDSLPKNDLEISYTGGCNYSVIDDTIYDRLVDNISLKRTAKPKTLKVKSLYGIHETQNKKSLKTIKNIKSML